MHKLFLLYLMEYIHESRRPPTAIYYIYILYIYIYIPQVYKCVCMGLYITLRYITRRYVTLKHDLCATRAWLRHSNTHTTREGTSGSLIKATHGLCLDASQRSTNGGKVHMWACDVNNQNQQWTYNAATKQIKATHGVCLDASQRNTNGGKVHMWACNTNNQNQQWTIPQASSLYLWESTGPDLPFGPPLPDPFQIPIVNLWFCSYFVLGICKPRFPILATLFTRFSISIYARFPMSRWTPISSHKCVELHTDLYKQNLQAVHKTVQIHTNLYSPISICCRGSGSVSSVSGTVSVACMILLSVFENICAEAR